MGETQIAFPKFGHADAGDVDFRGHKPLGFLKFA